MTKLKTLKDILDIEDHEDKCYINILRQEAINWIKSFHELKYNSLSHPQCKKYDLGYDGLDLENWIKSFFNLTEKDIKSKEV